MRGTKNIKTRYLNVIQKQTVHRTAQVCSTNFSMRARTSIFYFLVPLALCPVVSRKQPGYMTRNPCHASKAHTHPTYRWDVIYGAHTPQILPGYAWMSRRLADRNSSVSNTPWRCKHASFSNSEAIANWICPGPEPEALKRNWWGPELARAEGL